MKAMVFSRAGETLQHCDVPIPSPSRDQALIKVMACGVCRTDLHVYDGELAHPKLPLILGHEIVGKVVAVGSDTQSVSIGDRIGAPWLGSTCGVCDHCTTDKENLCDNAGFTGYTLDGGYAEYALVNSRYCFPIPELYGAAEAAPLLCAGLIGYRSLRMAGNGRRLGLYGFGAAAHIVAQIAAYQGREIYAFTRPGDNAAQRFARSLGAVWAGDSHSAPPEQLDAAIIFAPVGDLVPAALRTIVKGGTVVCAGIHMSDIPSFPYELLWGERTVRSVANLTRKDGEEFFEIAAEVKISAEIVQYPLERADMALQDLRNGRFQGAAVLTVETEM